MAKVSYILITWLHDIGFLGIILVETELTEWIKILKEPLFLVAFLAWAYYKILNERQKYKKGKDDENSKEMD